MRPLFVKAITFGLVCLLLAGQSGAQAAPDAGNTSAAAAAERLHAYLREASDSMHRNDLVAAEHSLRLALGIAPRSMAALNNLGIVLVREGKPADAIPLYER